jgi:hypothetical protein
MSAAEDPLHRAHLALNTSNLSDVLRSVADLTFALKTAVTMVDDQVLSLYCSKQKGTPGTDRSTARHPVRGNRFDIGGASAPRSESNG